MKVSEIVAAAVKRRAVPEPVKPPRVADAQLALKIDQQWRSEVKKKISELASDARDDRRVSRVTKEPFMRALHLGWSQAFMAAARRLKGLL